MRQVVLQLPLKRSRRRERPRTPPPVGPAPASASRARSGRRTGRTALFHGKMVVSGNAMGLPHLPHEPPHLVRALAPGSQFDAAADVDAVRPHRLAPPRPRCPASSRRPARPARPALLLKHGQGRGPTPIERAPGAAPALRGIGVQQHRVGRRLHHRVHVASSSRMRTALMTRSPAAAAAR